MATATLDTNSLGANGAEITLTAETLITLYVEEKTGSHNAHRVTIEYSPDGTLWVPTQHSLNGHGNFMTEQVVAARARACVCTVEGAASTVDVHLIAR